MLLSFVRAVSEWYGHLHSQNPSDMAIPVTLTQMAKVIWEGDAHITRVLGMGMPKTQGCPYHCNSRQLEPSNYRIGIGLPWNLELVWKKKTLLIAPICPQVSQTTTKTLHSLMRFRCHLKSIHVHATVLTRLRLSTRWDVSWTLWTW